MKKKTLIMSSLLCVIVLLIAYLTWPFNKTVPNTTTIKGPVLIDHLQGQPFHLQLIYSDIGLDDIRVYDVSSSQLSVNDVRYESFTEGFISSERNDKLLNLVNQFRSLQNLNAISYYYNYIETEHYDFISLSDGLEALYIINKMTGEVSSPYFDTPYASENQYVYHIEESTDAFYILTAKSNSYDAYLYRLDKETLSITDSKEMMPSSLAVNSKQYALSPNGTCFFIDENSLLVETLTESYRLPLPFTPSEVYFEEDQLYTFSLSKLFLRYAVLNENLETTATGELNLPNEQVRLVDASLNGTTLYTITYDMSHPLYRNYLTLYDLSTGEMIYCLALKSHNKLALLDANFMH